MNTRKTLLATAIVAAIAASNAGAQSMPFGATQYLNTGTTPVVVVRADLVGRGYAADLVTANRDSGDLTVFINDGNGAYETRRVPVGKGAGRINVLDLNNDGKPDLAVLNQAEKSVQLLINDGAGNFTTSDKLTVGAEPDRQLSWKGNALSRVVVSDRAEDTISYFAFGDQGQVIGSKVVSVGRRPNAMQNLDLDGDGTDELLVLNAGEPGDTYGTMSIIERESTAAALPIGVVSTVRVGTGPTGFSGPVDLDGDKRRDIVVANQTGNSVSVLLNRGNRTFDVTTYSVGASPGGVNFGDFNGDGMPDLVANNNAGSSVSVLINQGKGNFASSVSYAVGNGPSFPAIADMDGDGVVDLVVASSNDGVVTVLKGAGDGTFTLMGLIPTRAFITGRGSSQIVDAGGDGNPGIAVALSGSHRIALIPNLKGGFVRNVEYSRKRDDGSQQYFMTPIKAEIEALDSGAFGGWQRTGDTFRAYSRPASGREAVCRYFSSKLDSHFYSASPKECEQVAASHPDVWGTPEATELFYVPTSATGNCAAGLTPVYRVYDPSHTNHRHTAVKAKRDSAVAAGWVSEGSGNDGVVMCAP